MKGMDRVPSRIDNPRPERVLPRPSTRRSALRSRRASAAVRPSCRGSEGHPLRGGPNRRSHRSRSKPIRVSLRRRSPAPSDRWTTRRSSSPRYPQVGRLHRELMVPGTEPCDLESPFEQSTGGLARPAHTTSVPTWSRSARTRIEHSAPESPGRGASPNKNIGPVPSTRNGHAAGGEVHSPVRESCAIASNSQSPSGSPSNVS